MKLRYTLLILPAALAVGLAIHSPKPTAFPVPLCNPNDQTCGLGGN